MRNLLKRRPGGDKRPTLRERAAALKAKASRMIRHRSDQPSPATLPVDPAVERPFHVFPASDHRSHDGFRDLASDARRDNAQAAGEHSQETGMGRHESFNSAVPLYDSLLASTIVGRATYCEAADPKLVAMVDEWRSTEILINGPELADGPELEAVSAHHCELQRAIYAYPCASIADLRAKVPVFRDEQDDAVAESLAGEAWAGLFRDIERLASESEGVPLHLSNAGSPWNADTEIFALAVAFCDAFAKNGHADRAHMADEISEAEWQPFHDATQALMDKLADAKAKTIIGMALKCLAIAGSDAWAIPRHVDPAHDCFDTKIARQFEAAILADSLSLIGLDTQSGNALEPDAGLIALAERLEEARRHEDALWDQYESRESRASARRPKRPACLIFREGDHKFRLRQLHEHPAAMAGSEVTSDDIEWMSRSPLTHQVLRPIRDGERAWRDFPGRIPEIVPWPEAQARADEIVAAWKVWGDGIDRVRAEERTDEAADAASAATDATMAVLREIARTPAIGVEGMRAKLRALDLYCPATGSENRPRDLILHSLLKDAGAAPLPLSAEEA